MICMLERKELGSESACHRHPFPPFCNNCNSYVKGCNPASRDYLPQFVESLGAQEKFESAQCSVSMRDCVVWEIIHTLCYFFITHGLCVCVFR